MQHYLLAIVKNYLINALTLCLFVGSLPLFGQNATLEEGISTYDQGREYYLASNFDSAEYFFLIALDIYKKLGNDTLLSDCYHNLGTTYEQKKNYPQAFDFIRKGLKIRRKIYGEEKAPVGVSYRGIGNIHLDMGNYDSAIYYYEIVEPIFEKDTSSSQETKSILLSNLGSLHQEKANYEKALDYHLRALEIRRELFEEESFQIAASYNNLGNTYSDLGEYEKAMNYYEKALRIKQKVLDPDHPSLASSFNNMGSAYQLIGEDQLALENYEKALEIRKMIFPENHPYLGRSYYNIASIFLNLSEYQKALEAFDQATEIWLSSLGEDNPYTSMGFHGIGMAQIELQHYDQALVNTQKALDITIATFGKNHPSVIQIYQTLGEVYTRSKRFPEALELYEEAVLLQINLFGPEHSFLATIYKNMGDVYLDQGKLELAAKYFKDAAGIETQNFGNQHPDLAETYLNLADIYTRLNHCETADSYFLQSFEANVKSFSSSSADDLPDPESAALNSTILLETIEEKANSIEICLENDPEKLHKLAIIYEHAIRVLDKMISSYRSEEALLALQAKSRGIYEKAIRVMMDLYNQDQKEEYLEKALIYAEKGKASRFNQLFRASYAQNLTSVPMEIIDYEKSLGKKLAFYEEEKLSAEMDQDSGKIARLNTTIFSLHQSYDSLLKVIREGHPDYYQIVYSSKVADRHLIEKNLPSGAGFVEYFWGEEALYVFVLDGKHIFLKSLPLPELEQILKMRQSIYSYYLQSDSIFGVNMKPMTSDNWEEIGSYFYQELIEKVIPDLPERLVIVPDGALGYLPFETFTDQDGQYLVSKTAISYAYSATHFCQLFDRSGKRLIPGKKFLAVSPTFKQNEGVLADAESIRRSYLGPLVYSEQEVKSIQQILGGDILMGSQATKEAFFSMADQYQILHLSSHGKVNDAHPRFSFIAFFGENDTILTEGEPYVGVSGLYLADLYNLDLNADMVVLSACETGLGKLTQAEGIMSLARGFAFAGASSIVTTLWSVNDKTSADLMTLFYENLKQGMPRDQAMQKAKMAFIDENEAPFYWAGYIVIGDPGPIRQSTYWWIYVLIVGIIAIIGFVLIKKSPKRA